MRWPGAMERTNVKQKQWAAALITAVVVAGSLASRSAEAATSKKIVKTKKTTTKTAPQTTAALPSSSAALSARRAVWIPSTDTESGLVGGHTLYLVVNCSTSGCEFLIPEKEAKPVPDTGTGFSGTQSWLGCYEVSYDVKVVARDNARTPAAPTRLAGTLRFRMATDAAAKVCRDRTFEDYVFEKELLRGSSPNFGVPGESVTEAIDRLKAEGKVDPPRK